jgi:pantoate--beta-alanine ligase
MEIITLPKDMQSYAKSARQKNVRIGFVPTMGYLHAGHLSLVAIAQDQGRCDQTVMSVFVNPRQFGPNEDFDNYPRDFERDRKMAKEAGVDILFHPDRDSVYRPNDKTVIEVGEMGKVMCGISRPDHFRGVTTIVSKLFNIVQPHVAVFGQKDAQQFFIIRRMVQDLMMDVELIMAPIVREKDGLALSSRNVYLNPQERAEAVCLSQALDIARKFVDKGISDCLIIVNAMREHIQTFRTARVDYITIVDTENLKPLNEITEPSLIALAVYFGKTRLIDNTIIH